MFPSGLRLTRSGFPRIGDCSFTGMLNKALRLLSWLMVIWAGEVRRLNVASP
jgi:hypothetical protein